MTRTRRRPQVLVLAALLTVTVGLLLWLNGVGQADESTRGPVAIRAALAQKMRVVLEQLPPEGHQGHGGAAGRPSPLVCGTRVYGYEPADAITVEDVVTVYGFHMCALAEAGRSFDSAMKMVAPLVMRFGAGPPELEVAESSNGVSYRDRVKQLFPVNYQQSAFQETLVPEGMGELRRRFEAIAGPAAGPTRTGT
ncbi:MAG TPA: hypothetical protein VLL08_26495 [Kineosporiaceae bacterium]|nr:hypothetical protein [Kineosporiaceae bacterium]